MNHAFVYEVEDAAASTWIAEIAVVAEDRTSALACLKAAGVHKKQIGRDARPVRVEPIVAMPSLEDSPGAMVRRRLHDEGWTEWSAVTDTDPANWKNR